MKNLLLLAVCLMMFPLDSQADSKYCTATVKNADYSNNSNIFNLRDCQVGDAVFLIFFNNRPENAFYFMSRYCDYNKEIVIHRSPNVFNGVSCILRQVDN